MKDYICISNSGGGLENFIVGNIYPFVEDGDGDMYTMDEMFDGHHFGTENFYDFLKTLNKTCILRRENLWSKNI